MSAPSDGSWILIATTPAGSFLSYKLTNTCPIRVLWMIHTMSSCQHNRCTIISSLASLRAAALFLIAILRTQQQHLVSAQTTTAATTTTTTTTTPPLWSKTGCPPTWTSNSPLSSNSIVSLNSIVYQCKAGQQMGCSSWEPGNDTQNWSVVWTVLGSCLGTLQPTQEPTWTPTTGSPTWVKKQCPPLQLLPTLLMSHY
jgi:hypothetical protein